MVSPDNDTIDEHGILVRVDKSTAPGTEPDVLVIDTTELTRKMDSLEINETANLVGKTLFVFTPLTIFLTPIIGLWVLVPALVLWVIGGIVALATERRGDVSAERQSRELRAVRRTVPVHSAYRFKLVDNALLGASEEYVVYMMGHVNNVLKTSPNTPEADRLWIEHEETVRRLRDRYCLFNKTSLRGRDA